MEVVDVAEGTVATHDAIAMMITTATIPTPATSAPHTTTGRTSILAMRGTGGRPLLALHPDVLAESTTYAIENSTSVARLSETTIVRHKETSLSAPLARNFLAINIHNRRPVRLVKNAEGIVPEEATIGAVHTGAADPCDLPIVRSCTRQAEPAPQSNSKA